MKSVKMFMLMMATIAAVFVASGDSIFFATNNPYIVHKEFGGLRLHVSVRHGPSRESGWIIPVCYPEFYLTNGDMSAENFIRDRKEHPCFCGGEWWLVTNGYVNVDMFVTRQVWIRDDGWLRNEDTTNFVPRVGK